ncbi:MAG: DUF692 family protein [Nitrospirae bacterium]|nr:MAG: DUF692 family protein [Nitrospirota bacterium]
MTVAFEEDMATVDQEFFRRVARIPHHGLGLSVDVYTPDLFDLLDALAEGGAGGRGLDCDYLEIFKAALPALADVRRRLPNTLLEYHAEGLWITQPDLETRYPFEAELAAAAAHLRTLGSHWMNHECAAKQMAGYSFGTYLPPLFTRASAAVTARHIGLVQHRFDGESRSPGRYGPLFLLELPPLTYFGFGDVSVADFFRFVTEATPCGLVLDLGHLWTVYRYSDAWRDRDLREFLSDFLEAFPLERVVQIHVAGLAGHESGEMAGLAATGSRGPFWIDAHGAPIPDVLFDMLELVLAHPRLRHLKGIALEVDNKSVPLIVQEFRRLREQWAWWKGVDEQGQQDEWASNAQAGRPAPLVGTDGVPCEGTDGLLEQYDRYARIVTGGAADAVPSLGMVPGALEIYRHTYFPHEILHWGGELRDMFPETCRQLDRGGVALTAFVHYWVREPRPSQTPYDFFLLKLERFVEFVREVLPTAIPTAEREAAELRGAYQAACAPVTSEA